MKEKDFDKGLRQLALAHTEKPLTSCGDIVTTLWGDWKTEHKVMIYKVGIDIVSLSGRRFRQDDENLEDYNQEVPIMGVEHSYCALRLNKDGKPKEIYGIALTNFRTQEGIYWQKKHRDFNHIGLTFTLEEIPEENRLK